MNLADPDTAQLVGYVAAVLTTGSFVPQALMTLRTRDVSGISALMYSAFVAGVALWLAYGLLIGQWPIIIANAVALLLTSTILAVKLREMRRQAARPTEPVDQKRNQSPAE